ncbi:MAG: hypothetical protein KKH52_00655 [Nanoarchaeota archaeon]|nr:hypothetical protein [Nanoarchaeota archaeon]MBU1622523.1 hypothetical protein [Nanoarchaeota archaeon]MBU1973886.1 hypothetical protein [Nanoarchaeota archaeon]
MVIDNVVSSVKNVVKKAAVPIVAGYSALVMGVAGCGDTNIYNDGDGNNGGNTCATACQQVIYCCDTGQEDANLCTNFNNSPDSCVDECQDDPWSQAFIDCLSTSCSFYQCEDNFN